MPTIRPNTLARIVSFCAIAGSRSMSPAALLSLYLAQRSKTPDSRLAQRLSSTTGVTVTSALALGELAADKFPQTPNRTAPPALLGRVVTGGGAGALLGMLHDQPVWLSGLAGGIAALASTFVTFYLRMAACHKLQWPNAVLGLLEDGLILCSGWLLLKSLDADSPQNG